MADEPKTDKTYRAALEGIKRSPKKGLKRRVRLIGGQEVDVITGRLVKDHGSNSWAMIERALENIELTRRRMANDQIEIDRLRVETQQMIAELLT